MKRNLIIDSNNLLHRSFWVASKYKSVSVPKNFFTCIRSYMKDHSIEPTNVYMAWDDKLVRGSTNHRKQLVDDGYKATRDNERNAQVYELYRNIRKLCKLIGYHNIHPGVLEGDDVMAYLSKKLPGHNVIVSVDQDLLQLISPTVDVYEPMRKRVITTHNFEQFFPVPLNRFVEFKSAMGDKSDNIAGIPKVGPKRAVSLVNENFENLSDEHREILEKNKLIIDLNYSLQAYPNEVKLYQKQLDMIDTNHQPDIPSFIQECKSIECYDITPDFVNTLIPESKPSLIDTLT